MLSEGEIPAQTRLKGRPRLNMRRPHGDRMATVAIVLREADLAEFELRRVVICGFSESEADCGENDSELHPSD
jgi:hypothetical protein